MAYDHESINEVDYDILRMILSLHEEGAIIPEKVVNGYWELKRLHDRASAPLHGGVLAFMCWSLGFGKEPTKSETASPTVVQLWRDKELKHDDPVMVKYRNKLRPAVIKGVTGEDQVRVQLEDDDIERTVAAENVSVEMAVA
jgi:hypothetical protein